MPDISNISPLDENAILREVWDTSGINTKTELTTEQIESVNKLLSLSDIFGNAFLKRNVQTFMQLQKSKDRKSMKEFVDVVQSKNNDSFGSGDGITSKMLG